jgi:hypothetical protein
MGWITSDHLARPGIGAKGPKRGDKWHVTWQLSHVIIRVVIILGSALRHSNNLLRARQFFGCSKRVRQKPWHARGMYAKTLAYWERYSRVHGVPTLALQRYPIKWSALKHCQH